MPCRVFDEQAHRQLPPLLLLPLLLALQPLQALPPQLLVSHQRSVNASRGILLPKNPLLVAAGERRSGGRPSTLSEMFGQLGA